LRLEGRRLSVSRASNLAALIALVTFPFAATPLAQDRLPAQTAPTQQAPRDGASPPLARWFDAQTFSVSGRYDYIEDAGDRIVQNRMQWQAQMHGAFKVDAAGRYGVHAGLTTGDNFSAGWNATGIGTGEGSAKIYLTQLYVAAEPMNGIELHYGSLYPTRGQSTEITTYDNDSYVTAGRVHVRRPRELFFDDIIVSVGYVGYLDTAFVFDRTGAFSRQNYWRVLASKDVLAGLTVSTDYAVIDDDGLLHQGATWRGDQPWVDTVRGEYGVRLRGGSHQTAFAFSGQKQIDRVTMQVGYANVDPVFGVLNGDSYGAGDRVFVDGSFALPLDLTATWFVQKEISPPLASRNALRIDLGMRWNVLNTLKRAGRVPSDGGSARWMFTYPSHGSGQSRGRANLRGVREDGFQMGAPATVPNCGGTLCCDSSFNRHARNSVIQ
jgi:hypothetical protein